MLGLFSKPSGGLLVESNLSNWPANCYDVWDSMLALVNSTVLGFGVKCCGRICRVDRCRVDLELCM